MSGRAKSRRSERRLSSTAGAEVADDEVRRFRSSDEGRATARPSPPVEEEEALARRKRRGRRGRRRRNGGAGGARRPRKAAASDGERRAASHAIGAAGVETAREGDEGVEDTCFCVVTLVRSLL
jgi:hypothetical protein